MNRQCTWKIIFFSSHSHLHSSINLCDIFVKQKLWMRGLDQYWQFLFVCQYFLGCPLRMVIEGRGLIKLCFVCVCVCYGVFLHISYHCITLWLQMVTRMSLFNLRPLLLFNPSHKWYPTSPTMDIPQFAISYPSIGLDSQCYSDRETSKPQNF